MGSRKPSETIWRRVIDLIGVAAAERLIGEFPDHRLYIPFSSDCRRWDALVQLIGAAAMDRLVVEFGRDYIYVPSRTSKARRHSVREQWDRDLVIYRRSQSESALDLAKEFELSQRMIRYIRSKVRLLRFPTTEGEGLEASLGLD